MASPNGKTLDTNDWVAVMPEQHTKLRRARRIRWTVGLLVRLCIWYFLLTPFFRCPSNVSELTEFSPGICKPYLVAKSYVEPHVVPYYNTYGAPYVDSARPYARVLNEKVYTPASNVAKLGYERYGAPALDRAQTYGQKQWDANVVPHVQSAKGKANEWYGAQVAPHVEYITITASPYYHKAHGVYWTTLDGYILPFFAKCQPFIGKTYSSGQGILTTTLMPYAQSSWSSTIYLFNNSIWPKISSLYSENVEPQLVKIGQRLASYREGNRLGSVTDEVESSAEYTASPSSSTFADVSVSQSPITSSFSEATPTPSLSPSELAAQLREKIASDLLTWKERFASASENGVEDLEGRIVEIVESFLAGGVQTDGEKLVSELERAVQGQTTTIKSHIGALTESLPFEESQEEDVAVNELLKEVRNSAMSIRDKAHVLREWHASFEQDLIRKVSVAVNSTLAVLDDVRDLGLQEIGMRWAWMDGVTYKDWANYHALKAEFEDWKEKFRAIGLQHARIEAAKETADDILSHGMDVAESAAKELARLKDVGKWKIAAREVSDDFDTRSEPPPPLPKAAHAVDEDVASVSDEDSQMPSGTEDTPPEQSPVANDSTVMDSESSNIDQAQKPDERQDATVDNEELSDSTSETTVFSTDNSSDDSHTESEFVESKGEADAQINNIPFGVAAAVIPEQNSADFNGDTGNMDFDGVVESETSTLVEALEDIEDPVIPSKPSQAPTDHKAIEDLLSQLLADKDASYAYEIMKKLHAIYDAPQPRSASESVEDESAIFVTSFPEVSAVAELLEVADVADDPEESERSTSTIIGSATMEADVSSDIMRDQPIKDDL
ncbi:hypothetical protein BJX99DRAFT_254412 [Aspergillus californicus]